MSDDIDFARLMRPVAVHLLGQPNKRLSNKTTLRFGTQGSLAVEIAGDQMGTFYDHENKVGGGVLDLIRHKTGALNGAGVEWLRNEGFLPKTDAKTESNQPPRIAATHDYQKPDGSFAYQVVRYEPKSFKQRRRDIDGNWVWNLEGAERVPYRLPDLLKSAAHATVFVVEGEKDVDALRACGLVATCNPQGAGKWLEGMSQHLRDRDVVLLPDNDEAGGDHALDVARKLRDIARSIRIVRLPGLRHKGDVSDFLAAGGTAEELEELAAKAPQWVDEEQLEPEIAPSPTETLKRPVIQVVDGELAELATAGESALCDSRIPIFQRGNSLVRPVSIEVTASRGRTTIAAGLAEIRSHGMLDLLSQSAKWARWNKRQKKLLPCDPPTLVASVILSRVGHWRLPRISGVITTPTLRRDGSVLSKPGYDPSTRLYYVEDPSLRLPDLPAQPSREDAMHALSELKRLLENFPFVSEVDWSVTLCFLITPVVRGALATVPLSAFRASTAGTGKSYIADVASAINSGRPCPAFAASPSEEETEKRLVGHLLAAFSLISIDNVNGELGGDLLCQAVERPLIRVRPLGRSEIVELEACTTLCANGNNLRVRGDMVRRTLVCDLDANMERPELRTFDFDPVQEVLADRGRYVAACLTIVRAYMTAGMPGRLSPLASFNDWSDLVRSAVVWLGCEDPCKSMEAARDDDPELATLREVLDLWRGGIGLNEGSTVREIAERANSRTKTVMGEPADYAMPDFRDALLRISGTRGDISTRKLGEWLKSNANRIVDGHRVKIVGTAAGGVARWAVLKA